VLGPGRGIGPDATNVGGVVQLHVGVPCIAVSKII
jgi:hypothetical protein